MDGIKEIVQGMLDEIVQSYPKEYKTSFEILSKLLSNIIENPDNKKFRIVKRSNTIIQSKLLVIPQITDVLNVLGYEEGTGDNLNCLVYEGYSFEPLQECLSLLKEYLSNTTPLYQNNSSSGNSGNKVIVYQYDLTQGMVKMMSRGFLGKQIDGVWHTAVFVFGKEYFYGGGICVGEPKKTPYGIPVKELDFGYTQKTEKEVKDYIKSVDSKFTMQTYDILNHNCNHFTDDLLFFLVGKHLPASILKQHEEILSTPMGQQFRPILEGMSRGNNAFLPNMFEGGGNNSGGGYNNFNGY